MPESLINGSWIFLSAAVGFLIGSFLNVCIYRLPAGITIVRGHSFCPNCRHHLGAADLIPVLSYLFLGRRCRYCHEPISPRYARIELLCGVFFGLAGWLWRPWTFVLPDYIKAWLTGLSAVSLESARLLAGLGLVLTAVMVFSALLVWSVIFFDQHLSPWGLLLFASIPAALRLALQPERLASHLLALALSLLFFLLLTLFRLLPEPDKKIRIRLGAGLAVLGLMAGLQAIQPVLAVLLIELVLLALFQNRSRQSEAGKKRARQVWLSLPLQGVLIGSVLWLIF
jgi:prepilin signal peptidase PulO-like enzyme (type II secretory pathway)